MSHSRWSAEKLFSLTAMLISLTTLIIFIYQTNLMKDQNHITVLPYLAVATSTNPPQNLFELSLKNHGMGPAILESVKLFYQDSVYNIEHYKHTLLSCLIAIAPELDKIESFSSATTEEGMAIPANSSYTVIQVYDSEEDFRNITQTLNQLQSNGLQYEVIYKSILGARWRVTDNTKGPESL